MKMYFTGSANEASALQCFVCDNCPTVQPSTNHEACNAETAIPRAYRSVKPVVTVPGVYQTPIQAPALPKAQTPMETQKTALPQQPQSALGILAQPAITTALADRTVSSEASTTTFQNIQNGARVDVVDQSMLRTKRNLGFGGPFKCFRMQAKGITRLCLPNLAVV